MPNPVFPVLSTGHDSAKYSIELEDTGMQTELEGGYVASRARHTRRPRRTWSDGFTDISQADADLLQAFWDQVSTHTIFDWTNPADDTVTAVRFTPGTFSLRYAGVGANRRYSVEFKVQQA